MEEQSSLHYSSQRHHSGSQTEAKNACLVKYFKKSVHPQVKKPTELRISIVMMMMMIDDKFFNNKNTYITVTAPSQLTTTD